MSHSNIPSSAGEELPTPGWEDEVPTEGVVELPPDPRAMEGLGRNHSLQTALADLVDNAIDAEATDVLIRTIRKDGRIRSIYIVDNGCGMDAETIDAAMTIGGRRTYRSGDLGHFGIGMKAASFSQAESLTVMSGTKESPPVGRRWEVRRNTSTFKVDVVPEAFAQRELDKPWGIPWTGNGTVVRWDRMIGIPATANASRVEQFVSQMIREVRNHLGLVFHRILESGRIQVNLDVEDIGHHPGPRHVVKPINPFGYLKSGRTGYPKQLTAETDHTEITFQCHIWPGRSDKPGFKLTGGPERRQGLYIYRRNRLLQAGDEWGGITAPNRRLQVARVAVDINDDTSRFFAMNPEKSRVVAGPDFAHLAETAKATDGTTFATYLDDAELAFQDSRKRNRLRKPMHFPPGKGFSPGIRRTISDELSFVEEDRHIDIRWKKFAPQSEDFFEVDRESQVLWLNERYRSTIIGGSRGGLNDAPIVKTLLYLIMEDVFRGERLGSRDKDNIELWQQILIAAIKSELA